MYMVKCTEEDWQFILGLRNMHGKSFLNSNRITFSEHFNFMRQHNDDYYICWNDDHNTRMGFIGVVNGDIRLASFNKMGGVGTFMLNFIKDKYPNATGKIKADNQASIKLFDKCGVKYEII